MLNLAAGPGRWLLLLCMLNLAAGPNVSGNHNEMLQLNLIQRNKLFNNNFRCGRHWDGTVVKVVS